MRKEAIENVSKREGGREREEAYQVRHTADFAHTTVKLITWLVSLLFNEVLHVSSLVEILLYHLLLLRGIRGGLSSCYVLLRLLGVGLCLRISAVCLRLILLLHIIWSRVSNRRGRRGS